MMTTGSDAIEQPNFFSLSGCGVTITLVLGGITGQPVLTYQDSHLAKNFTGEELTLEETALGRLVSVTTVKSVDAGYTGFSVVIPNMNLIGGHHHVDTIGITSTHRTTLAGPVQGQLTTYHVIHLHGTASQVES
jgi:hypothetical protein